MGRRGDSRSRGGSGHLLEVAWQAIANETLDIPWHIMRHNTRRRFDVWHCIVGTAARSASLILLISIVLFGCAGDTPRIVINNCVDELPESAIGWYTLRKIEFLNTASGYRKIDTPRRVLGWLKINPDQKMKLSITEGRLKKDIDGYYDVNVGILFIYLDDTFEDVVLFYQYHYTDGAIVLERYDTDLRLRITTYWRLLPATPA